MSKTVLSCFIISVIVISKSYISRNEAEFVIFTMRGEEVSRSRGSFPSVGNLLQTDKLKNTELVASSEKPRCRYLVLGGAGTGAQVGFIRAHAELLAGSSWATWLTQSRGGRPGARCHGN